MTAKLALLRASTSFLLAVFALCFAGHPARAQTPDVLSRSIEICIAARKDVHSVQADLLALGWMPIAPADLSEDQARLFSSRSALERFDSRITSSSNGKPQWVAAWERVEKGIKGLRRLNYVDTEAQHSRFMVWADNSSIIKVVSRRFPQVATTDCEFVATPELMVKFSKQLEAAIGAPLDKLPPVQFLPLQLKSDEKNKRVVSFYFLNRQAISELIGKSFSATASVSTHYWTLKLAP